MNGRRRRGAAAALAMACALLGGCVSIPSQGPPIPGRSLVDAQRPPRVQFYAYDPEVGDTPTGIVRGFLRAAADFSFDHKVARSYLTPEQRSEWRPDAPVVVYGGQADIADVVDGATPSATSDAASSPASSPASASTSAAPSGTPSDPSPTVSPVPGAEVSVRVEVRVVARIDDRGVYAPSPAGDVQRVTFRLVPVNGQWRISNPVDGVLISEDDFQVTFGDVSLYFPERTGRWLIPDVRWFPLATAASGQAAQPQASALVSALLDGPSPWLSAAVASAAPQGTELTANGVRIDSGVVTIDLTRRARDATPAQRQVLFAQMQATLTKAVSLLGAVTRVMLTVEQARFEVPLTAVYMPKPADEAPVDSHPVVLDSANRLARLDQLAATTVEGLPALGPDAIRPAVSVDGKSYAAIINGGSSLVTLSESTSPRIQVRAPGLTTPSFDSYGWVWTSPGSSDGVLWAVRGTERLSVPAPWLSGLQVRSLRISREGSRALVVAARGRQSYVFVAAVTRDAVGLPIGLTAPPLRLVAAMTDARDGAWLDSVRVAVLGTMPSTGERAIHLIEIGGKVVTGVSAPEAVALTVGSSQYQVWIQTPEGAAFQVGAGFRTLPGLSWPSVPG